MDPYILENPHIRVSPLFMKALKNFRTQTGIMLVYSLSKLQSTQWKVVMQVQQTVGQYQLEYNHLYRFGAYLKLNEQCKHQQRNQKNSLLYKSHIVRIAEDLHEVVYLPEGDINMLIPLNEDDIQQQENSFLGYQEELNGQDEGKKIAILTQQIKYEASKKNLTLKWISQLIFFMNQILIIFGFVLEFQNSTPTEVEICKNASMVFMFIFLVISVYQYIDLYVIIVLLIICLPFIVIFMIYQCIKQCQQKRKANNFLSKLLQAEVEFSPGKVEGDPECHICLSTYNLRDKVIQLPCNNLHHFHSNCIGAWLKMTPNCPLCRKDFSENDDSINQPLYYQNQDL